MDVHISVLEDIRKNCPELEITNWCLSAHAWVFNRRQDAPRYINATTWRHLTLPMIEDFQREYDSFLQGFDVFIVGYASCFAMLYERYGKPILMVNAVRYDVPFCWTRDVAMLERHKACLRRLHADNRLVVLSNNKADQDYLEAGCGIPSVLVPSLCLYTGIRYTPTRPTFLVYTGAVPEHPLITQRPKTPFAWSDLGTFRGIIHIPYEVSTMSMFEHYAGGLPLFFPSKAFWKSAPAIQSMSAYWGDSPPSELGDFCDLSTWIDRSDVYETFVCPNTHYFDSYEHLFQLLESFVYVDTTEHIASYVGNVLKIWNQVIETLRRNVNVNRGDYYRRVWTGRILPLRTSP
jgi:hypothetical protein